MPTQYSRNCRHDNIIATAKPATPTAIGNARPMVAAGSPFGHASRYPNSAVLAAIQPNDQVRQWPARTRPRLERRVSAGLATTSATGRATETEVETALVGPLQDSGAVSPCTSANWDRTARAVSDAFAARR